MKVSAIRFERTNGQYRLHFSYDATAVAIIKTVPSYARSYDPTFKVWTIDGHYAEQLAGDMSRLGFVVTGLEQAHSGDETDWARLLFRRVGQARAGPVFRSLSRVLHPDTPTGDAQLQRERRPPRTSEGKGMTATAGITAMDLDDLLSALTPAQAAELQQHIPTAWADQLRAAQTESITLIETVENRPGGTRHIPASGVDDWLRLGLHTFVKWVAGSTRTCTHMPDPRRPEPVWSCAWKPGLVVCSACLRMLKAHGAADTVCDCCGHVCAPAPKPATRSTPQRSGLADSHIRPAPAKNACRGRLAAPHEESREYRCATPHPSDQCRCAATHLVHREGGSFLSGPMAGDCHVAS